MALVNYPESESEGEELETTSKQDQHTSRKRKAEQLEQEAGALIKSRPPPPLPTSFHSQYATNVRASTTDDPSLHAGRTRQVRHVVGNWPTHVYLEWYPLQSELVILDGIIQRLRPTARTHDDPNEHIHSFLRSELGVQLPLHISLSAPLVLKTTEKEQFEGSMKAKLADSHIKKFSVKATRLHWVANHDKTRFFLVLRLSKPEGDELNRLLSICNGTTQQFGLPHLYEDTNNTPTAGPQLARDTADKSDAFHISIAWTLVEPGDHVRQTLTTIADEQVRDLKVSFFLLKLKIGNAVIDLPLD